MTEETLLCPECQTQLEESLVKNHYYCPKCTIKRFAAWEFSLKIKQLLGVDQ